MWAQANGLVSCSAWTKRLLVSLTGSGLRAAFHLVRAYGSAFRGDEVGAMGRDILEFSLRQPPREARLAALESLERWLDDDYGPWLDIMNDHIDREQDQELKATCRRLLEDNMEEILYDEFDDEFDARGRRFGGARPEYYEVSRKLPNQARGQLETSALPGFLEKLVGVKKELTLGILESLKIGKLVMDEPNLEFLMTERGVFRAWDRSSKFSFSVEPTAIEGNWLVFMRFR